MALITRTTGLRAEGGTNRIVGRVVSIKPRKGVNVGGLVAAEIEDRLGVLRFVFTDYGTAEAHTLYEANLLNRPVAVEVIEEGGKLQVLSVAFTSTRFLRRYYQSLNDAAKRYNLPELAPGDMEVWFLRPDKLFSKTLSQGTLGAWNTSALPSSHVRLGSVVGWLEEEDLFSALQEERWSPRGEAKKLLSRMSLHRASMQVGDVLVLHHGTHRMLTEINSDGPIFTTVGKTRGRR